MQRTGDQALRSRGLAGSGGDGDGGGGTVTTAGCSVRSPEIAILIQGSQARGTFISPDFKGQEGAPRNRAGARWGRWGIFRPLPSFLSRDPGLHGTGGRRNPESVPKA